MAHRVLELTLVSASNLPSVNLFSGMQVYAVVSVYGDPRTRQRTLTDRDGETEPAWNHTVWFAVSPTAAAAGRAYLHVLLRTERYFAGSFGFGDCDVAARCSSPSLTCSRAPAPPEESSRHRGALSIAYRLGPVVVPPSEPDCQAVMPPCRPARRNFNWNGRFVLGIGSGLVGGGFTGTAAYRSG
ncbi:protein SRC2-like [Aegilops tauschii subsp. strangulata]|uniref:protein SRC2-like n=1 Tax=Aegilops tauschii subsp. strangulata TaxID=200361 RepID=UPI001ABD43D6|nr:protein SRC2-like [Aegilops tauschii subsp. strangulata]